MNIGGIRRVSPPPTRKRCDNCVYYFVRQTARDFQVIMHLVESHPLQGSTSIIGQP